MIDKISFLHLNSLLLLGVAIFGGTLGGRLFQISRCSRLTISHWG